ncbi:hypothetical protein HY641_01295 [Candidatus Woesearchaeota archaeon]|nr:hypothetical protein [Candidatus Woesearchaeota archaeon]
MTTVQIAKTTAQLLRSIKEEESMTSMDEVIRTLAQEHKETPRSMFGAAKGMKWSKKDRMDFHED